MRLNYTRPTWDPMCKRIAGIGFVVPWRYRWKALTEKLVHQILTIDETQQSMTFAGLPEGSKVRLMKANFSINWINAILVAAETRCHHSPIPSSPNYYF